MRAPFYLLYLLFCFFIYVFAGSNIELGLQAKISDLASDSALKTTESLTHATEKRVSETLKASNSSLLDLQGGFLSESVEEIAEKSSNELIAQVDDALFLEDSDGLFVSTDKESDQLATPSIEKTTTMADSSLESATSFMDLAHSEKAAHNTAKDQARKYHKSEHGLHEQRSKHIDTDDDSNQAIAASDRKAELLSEAVAPIHVENSAIQHKGDKLDSTRQYTDKNSKTKNPRKVKRIDQSLIQSGSGSTDDTITSLASKQYKLSDWASVLTIFMIGFTVIFMIFLAEVISSAINSDLKKTLDGIFRDTIVLGIVIIVVCVAHYYDVLSMVEYYINIQAASIGLLIFGILWAVLGLSLVLLAHFYIRDWRKYEKEYQKREAIFRHFEDLYYNPNRTSELESELKNRRRQLEFFLIRQEFITPSFLPILGEDFLRDDFDFASYLAKCISKVNQQAFRFDFVTFITFSLAIGACAGIYYYINHLMLKILIFSPFVLYVPLRVLARKMTRIYGQLVTVVKSPYDVDLAKFDSIRQPLINLDKLSMPAYLTNRASTHHFKRTCSIVQLANRHMRLYWLSSPRFMIRMLHVILTLHLLWVTYLVVSLSFKIETIEGYYYWIALGASILISLVNLCYTLPQILRLSAIVNNIQMLKDRQLSREVVEEKMQARSLNMRDLYSVIKTVRRQSIGSGNDNSLRLYVIDFVREIFKELRGPKKERPVTCADLTTIAHLCGRDLSDREAMILAHDITCRLSSDITFEEFMDAVEKISNDVRSNPVDVSKGIFKELTSLENTSISSRNLRSALEKLDLLEEHEIEAMIHEVKYLPVQNAEYSLDHLSTLIRDSIEGMPR